jgi:hypothetical protein
LFLNNNICSLLKNKILSEKKVFSELIIFFDDGFNTSAFLNGVQLGVDGINILKALSSHMLWRGNKIINERFMGKGWNNMKMEIDNDKI